jgi:hypothetical protein
MRRLFMSRARTPRAAQSQLFVSWYSARPHEEGAARQVPLKLALPTNQQPLRRLPSPTNREAQSCQHAVGRATQVSAPPSSALMRRAVGSLEALRCPFQRCAPAECGPLNEPMPMADMTDMRGASKQLRDFRRGKVNGPEQRARPALARRRHQQEGRLTAMWGHMPVVRRGVISPRRGGPGGQ